MTTYSQRHEVTPTTGHRPKCATFRALPKNEVVKTIRTDIEGVASTSADLLPYGKFRIVESEAPNGYLTDGAKPIDFTITENGKIVDLTEKPILFIIRLSVEILRV